MSVSGLVLTFRDDAAVERGMAAISADPRLTVGDRFACKVAVVAETPSVKDDLDLVDELRRTPGVVHVDVACVHLDTDAPADRGASFPRISGGA